jgi:hypothetical protein
MTCQLLGSNPLADHIPISIYPADVANGFIQPNSHHMHELKDLPADCGLESPEETVTLHEHWAHMQVSDHDYYPP